MTQEQRIAVAAAAEKLVGDPYNYAALADIGLEDLGWHWKLLMKVSRAARFFICSQAVVTCGTAGGMNWLCGKASADQVAPSDLANRPGVVPVTITAD